MLVEGESELGKGNVISWETAESRSMEASAWSSGLAPQGSGAYIYPADIAGMFGMFGAKWQNGKPLGLGSFHMERKTLPPKVPVNEVDATDSLPQVCLVGQRKVKGLPRQILRT